MSEGTTSGTLSSANDGITSEGPTAGHGDRPSRARAESPDGNAGNREKTRIGGLDGLRGIAALGVLAYHFTACYEGFFHFRGSLPFSFQYGMYGVQLFFFISGFVIFMTVERTKRPIDFAISRFIRLYPAFWISLLICIVILATTDGPEPFMGRLKLMRRALVGITMLSGWLRVTPISGVYWTLEVEMGFYVVVFALLAAGRIGRIIPVLSALVMIGVIDGLYSRHHPNPLSPWLRTAHFLDYVHCMLIGVLIYKIRKDRKLSYFLIMVACFFVPFSQDPKYHESWKETIVAAILAGVVVLATSGWIPVLDSKPLVFLGGISYSLYLNHSLMGDHIIYHAERAGISPTGSILIATVASLALAVLITKACEEPISAALKRRLRRTS